MIALADLKHLPLHEKLIVMEALWDSIAQQEDQLEVPQWHKDILDKREKLVQSGQAEFIDWEKAKKDIKAAIS